MKAMIMSKSAAAHQGKYALQLRQRKDAQRTLLKSNKPNVLSCLLWFVMLEHFHYEIILDAWIDREID